MKTLIFLLLLLCTVASQATSKTIKIYKTQENTEIALQSGRSDNEYRLFIEITSDTWVLPHGPCTIIVTANQRSLTLPCSVTRSVEIVSPRQEGSVITEYLTVGGRRLLEALSGESALMQIGRYKIELTREDLRLLRLAAASR